MAKDSYWFKHDANARHDPKMTRLIASMQMNGYGIFWGIIEMLREATDYTMDITDADAIAMQLQCDRMQVEKVLKEFGLFQIEGTKFYSERLSNSLLDKSMKASENARVGWKKRKGINADACDGMQTHAIREDKKREDKIRKEDTMKFGKPPSLEAVVKYCKETSSTIDPEHFFNTYASQGWIKANGIPIKNWKLTIKTWEKKQEGKNGSTKRMLS